MLLSLLPMLVLAPSADAAFGGKVKNIRIRERNNTNGYRVVVVVQDDDGDSFAGANATVALEAVDGGPTVSPVSLTDLRGQRLLFSAANVDLGGVQDDGTISLHLIVNDVLEAGDDSDTWLSLTPDAGWDESGYGETGKLKARLTTQDDGTGTLEVTVLNEDRSWDASGVESVTFSTSTGDESILTTMDREGFRGRLVATFESAQDLSGYTYDVVGTLMNGDGRTVDSRSDWTELGAESVDDGLYKSTLKERRRGGHKIVSYTVSDDSLPLRGLSTEISNANGEVLLTSFDESPVGIERDFVFDGQTFDSSPLGLTFSVTLTLRDADGFTVGDTIHGDLTHGSTVDATDHPAFIANLPVFAKTDADDSGATLIVNDVISAEGNVGYEFSILGDDDGVVQAIEMQFNEPFEGPSPQENPIQADFAMEWTKWVDTFSTGTELGEDNVTIEQILFTGDGGVLDEVLWSGPPSSTMQNGTGTRRAVGAVRTRPSLL